MQQNMIQFGILVLLVFLSAFFSSAETAMSCVSRVRIKTLVEENNKKAVAVQSILERDKGTVRCIPVNEEWFGMTYSEELSLVKERLSELREEGVYVRETW